jgi:hypothetical protein
MSSRYHRFIWTLDEILWNVAKTAIAQLGFVDCVIYLVDTDHSTLIPVPVSLLT